MGDFTAKLTNNISSVYIIVCAIVIGIIIYATYQLNLGNRNCSKIKKYKPSAAKTIKAITDGDTIISSATTLNELYVKTAYNCCCSGEFKNDYVDNCALLRCSKQKVRALHFDIYSLNNRPVIATSSVKGNTYKEVYNSLDMYATMDYIKTNFINNSSDPLFLIFCVNSNVSTTYESMYTILVEIFGTGNITGNLLYFTNDLGNAKILDLCNKVVICVEAYDTTVFYASSLALITSLNLNGSSKIYRETDIIDLYTSNSTIEDNLSFKLYPQVLFPNRQAASNNYDFVTTGINYGVSFIGMCFQKNDGILQIYKDGFKNYSFINKKYIDGTTVTATGTDVLHYYSTEKFGKVPTIIY